MPFRLHDEEEATDSTRQLCFFGERVETQESKSFPILIESEWEL